MNYILKSILAISILGLAACDNKDEDTGADTAAAEQEDTGAEAAEQLKIHREAWDYRCLTLKNTHTHKEKK